MADRRRTIKDDGPTPIDRYVGGRIRDLRKNMGLSQTKLGDELGVTFQQVQKYENATNRMGASNLYKTAKFLGVDVDYFFEGIDEAQSDIGTEAIQEDNAMASPEAVRFARDVTKIPNPTVRKTISQLLMATIKAGS